MTKNEPFLSWAPSLPSDAVLRIMTVLLCQLLSICATYGITKILCGRSALHDAPKVTVGFPRIDIRLLSYAPISYGRIYDPSCACDHLYTMPYRSTVSYSNPMMTLPAIIDSLQQQPLAVAHPSVRRRSLRSSPVRATSSVQLRLYPIQAIIETHRLAALTGIFGGNEILSAT